MRKDDPAGRNSSLKRKWKEGRKKEPKMREEERWRNERGRERNKICIRKIFSGSVPSRILWPVSPLCLGRGWTRAKASNVNPSAYDVMTVLDIP